MTRIPIRRALLSVYDKTGLPELAKALHESGAELVSTGTTARTIEQAGIPVTRVEDLTGFPEALDGRVKTLHPRVHAGLLADSMNPGHNQQLTDLGIQPFQLLVSNLYPFEQTVASGADHSEIIEQIDIGGPAMVRAAAKNHGSVAVVTSPDQYGDLFRAIADNGFTLEQRRRLAARAYAHTAAYDAAVSSWFAASYAPDEVARETGWPDFIAQTLTRSDALRYGENPHQKAALYKTLSTRGAASGTPGVAAGTSRTGSADSGTPAVDAGIASAEVLHGKAMSYNNYVDADSARRAAFDFAEPCVAIIKHSNPCGIAIGTNIAIAHAKALACDPLSAYGGVVAANSAVTDAMAGQIIDGFAEVVIAPDFDPAAVEILTGKWKNIRLLRCAPPPGAAGGGTGGARTRSGGSDFEFRPVTGGMLAQTWDRIDAPGDDPATWELKAGEAADGATLADLAFAWRACRAVKSNAILLAADGASVGVGMGQVNRVDSSRLAVARAGNRAAGSVAASDAYFPFPDAFEILAQAGVRAVAEPGGSIRDDLVIEAARAAGVTLYFTGVRHFYH
ncbi:MAG TPA: bifunctional phosphoribosylaminoimidazolecarboxamide formyltransferase/inosine monophosphate cyclohydrolase [Trebonia sp.]|nr:bifunctional phosphoribosylaminoimidazolecarboxamide formyltransferase/inosine monophosphate cyclohydrolase [Trebonia sp.]